MREKVKYFAKGIGSSIYIVILFYNCVTEGILEYK